MKTVYPLAHHTAQKTPEHHRKNHPNAAFITFETAECCKGLERDQRYQPLMPDVPQLAGLAVFNGRGSVNKVEVIGEKALTWWTNPGQEGGPGMLFDKAYAHASVAAVNLLSVNMTATIWGFESETIFESKVITIPPGEHLIVAEDLFNLKEFLQISINTTSGGLAVHYLVLI